jgi:formylglycine-generating enzyme required for sulfatase activity
MTGTFCGGDGKMQPLRDALLLTCLTSPFLSAAFGQPPAERKEQILKRFVDEFVLLTPGEGKYPASFVMGSEQELATEKPAHKVTFKYSFAMAKYEVTQELYEVVMARTPSKWKGPRNSVEKVNWHEANEFCAKVTAELRKHKLIKENEIIRLPTEAEWEYACRAGTTTKYSFGDDVKGLTEYAWYKDNSKGHDPPVGKKRPNAWGLYDMHGYIWEWCADAWGDDYQGAPSDGTARDHPKATERVLRGGSWADSAEAARSGFRHHNPSEARSDTIGFRCVRAKANDRERRRNEK